MNLFLICHVTLNQVSLDKEVVHLNGIHNAEQISSLHLLLLVHVVHLSVRLFSRLQPLTVFLHSSNGSFVEAVDGALDRAASPSKPEHVFHRLRSARRAYIMTRMLLALARRYPTCSGFLQAADDRAAV